MNARDFARQRAIIERRFSAKPSKRSAAMRRLVRDSGAAVMVSGTKAMGWRLPDGSVVCVKHRFRDRDRAETELQIIAAKNWNHHRVPTRVYACRFCNGWHLTSQPSRFDAAE
ncbi:hypothetical protein [Microvirga sp. 17 mud 1-3]|uniref:hypothetical protein n=1 Tax=Microvirga sp. 17 mud 1-3 TaxID=2082949 RepID=UPI000D6C40DC|nr:hypothetical protein [Microvirga sp. 17 mud 1-3]AWM87352.1 hypothetical protein C4E04_11815 [Microvirga sp. 17 mud 1-3]